MKTLYLLRHAKSSWDEKGLDDIERELAGRGRKAAAKIGAYMLEHEMLPDVVLCSPATRASQTCTIVAQALGIEDRVRVEPSLYPGSAEAIVDALRALREDTESVLVVGHNPSMEDAATGLGGEGKKKALKRVAKKDPTAGLAVIAFLDVWQKVAPGAGYLRAFIRPRDL
jgi:phosphohistidine phosphatase